MGNRTHKDVIKANLRWFLESGIMLPADGSAGVAERIAVLQGNEAAAQICEVFPARRELKPGVVVLEHRRADCNCQTAFLFDLAAEVFEEPGFRAAADNIVAFTVQRSGLLYTDSGSPKCGLWGWATHGFEAACFPDDNAWVATLLQLLARRGRPQLLELGVNTARRLHAHVAAFLDNPDAWVTDASAPCPPELAMAGMRLSPHSLGLPMMAFAHAARTDTETPYRDTALRYFRAVRDASGEDDAACPDGPPRGRRWTLSEYSYLAFAGAIAAQAFSDAEIADVTRHAADVLVSAQAADGHFPAEHHEAPSGSDLADLIYTQNWATLGLYHAWRLFDHDPEYRCALDRSLTFLAGLQDDSCDAVFRGCWRGMYDTAARAWAGGDRHEGGANSIYSGWTNAPIALAFLLDMRGDSLFAG